MSRLLLATVGFILVSLAIFGVFLFGPVDLVASSKFGDTHRYFVFMRSFGFEQLREGNLALWNPHIFSGAPFVGVFQSAMFYPLNSIYMVLPLGKALNFDLALHLVLMGVFVFAWLRGRELRAVAAFFAAIMVMLSAPYFMRVLAGQLSVLGTLVWSPLLFLVIDRLAERCSLGWILVGIFATAMMILAGHPPTVFMAGVVTGLYCVMPLLKTQHRSRFVLSLLAIAVAPIFLTAVQLWTGLSLAGEGSRAAGMTYQVATSFSFPPENLLTVLVADALGDGVDFNRGYWGRWFYWDAVAYLGVVGFLFAIHGAIRGRCDLRRVALILVPLLTVVACGRYTAFYSLLYDFVPGFDHFRAPSKFLFFAGLFTAALAGVGVDRLLSTGERARGATVTAFLLAFLLALAALWTWLVPVEGPEAISPVRLLASLNDQRLLDPDSFPRWDAVLLRGLLLSTAFLLAAGVLLWLGRRRRWAIWLLILLGVVELFYFAQLNRGGSSIDPKRPGRPDFAETCRRAGGDRVLLPRRASNTSMRSGGSDLWGYDPVVLRRYVEFMAFTQGRRPQNLDNVGGRYPSKLHPLHSLLRGRFRILGNGSVAEHSEPLPRFMLVREYRVIEDRPAILRAMAESSFDARRTVILEKEPLPPPESVGGGGEVKLLDASTDELTLEVELEQAAILVITDAYARGWRARGLPGSTQSEYQLLPADYVLRAIPLAAGHHRLRVEYSPLAYRVGARVSIGSGVLLLAATTYWWRRRRTRKVERA